MPKNELSETHRFFPGGDWEGFYVYGGENDRHNMNFSLNFKNGTMSGSGSDDVGSFSWKGAYDIEGLTCKMAKHYSTHIINYAGNADENGIWGIWTNGEDLSSLNKFNKAAQEKILETFGHKLKGGFHIWPAKNERNEAEAEVEAIEITVETTAPVKNKKPLQQVRGA